MFTVDWYIRHFAPLICEATDKGFTGTADRFLSWVDSNPDRRCKHAGIRHFVAEFGGDDWAEVVRECGEIS